MFRESDVHTEFHSRFCLLMNGYKKYGIKGNQFQEPSFTRTDDNSSDSSATSAISLLSPDNSKKPDTNRWIKPQIDMLVSLRWENIGLLEPTRSHKM